jgi:hypothetical protein
VFLRLPNIIIKKKKRKRKEKEKNGTKIEND